MTAKKNGWLSAVVLGLALMFVWNCPGAVRAADLKLEVKLIWGTNDETSPDPSHKKLDSTLTKWLGNKYKWKNYFEVNRQVVTISPSAVRSVILSKACQVDIRYLGGSRIEVKLHGNGKLVLTGTHTLPQNDRLVIAGDGKNDSAWFIAFKLLSPDGK